MINLMTKKDKLDFYEGTEAAQRFKDFTRAIVSVPKKEIDEAAKEIANEKVKLNRSKRRKPK